MKICQVMGGDDDGGLETHFADLSNGLATLGDDVTAIAHERYRRSFRGNVSFVPLDLTRGRRNPLLRRRLRQLIDAASPDIVHAQASKAAALVAAVKPPTRLVATVHNIKRDLSPYRCFDAVIGVSAGVLDALEHPRKTVVYNGVSPPPTALTTAQLRRRFAIGEGRTVTLAIGRLVPAKGFVQLIKLWDESLGQLLIVGDGPQGTTLRALAKGKPVTLAGFQANARSFMPAAHLQVFASEREGFSYAMAEALLARLPIVSTPVPGASELLPAKYLAPPGRLKSAIRDCLGDPEATRERLRGVFEWAACNLTAERMTRRTRAVYLGLGKARE